jgi:hypothetical protein
MGAAVGRRYPEHSPGGGAVQLSAAPFDPRAHRGGGQGLSLAGGLVQRIRARRGRTRFTCFFVVGERWITLR